MGRLFSEVYKTARLSRRGDVHIHIVFSFWSFELFLSLYASIHPRTKGELYHKEEHVVVVRTVLVVHAESSVHVAQVVVVIQLREGLVGVLSFAVETFEHVIT